MAADKMPGPGAVDSDVEFDPAVAWFQKRLGMTRAQVDALSLEYRRKVFFVTGLSDLEAIKAVQDSLARAQENGATFEEWKAQVKEKGLFQGPQFTKARLETIFRTNMQNAFATGRYMELTAPAVLKRRPYWRFSAVRDNRTTKVCAASHGTILPASHEWWKTHIPPLHFNCRSTFVPMTEKDAKAAGITKNPTQLKAALGFGNPPFGVPAAARDLPTEAQREAAEKVSEEVQTTVEERQNASSELTAAKHEKSVADKKLREAKKELIRAPQKDVPARRKDVEEAQKAAEAAGKHVEKAKEVLEKTQKNTEETLEKHKGQPTFWGLIKERLKRIAKGVAKGAVSVMGSILGPFRKFKNAVLDGEPVLEGVTPDGQKIHFKRGDIIRGPMLSKGNGKGGGISRNEKHAKIDLTNLQPVKTKHLIGPNWEPEGDVCSSVSLERQEEIQKDFEDIRSEKIKPTKKQIIKSSGKLEMADVYIGHGGIVYRIGTSAKTPKLFIESGKGVFTFRRKEIEAIREIQKGRSLEWAAKKYGLDQKMSENIRKAIEMSKRQVNK